MEGATSNGDDVRSRRLLIWVSFWVMELCAAQLLSQGAEAGGASAARLLCAYAAWLLALVAVLLAVAFQRLPRAIADVVDRALTVRAAPFPLLAFCTDQLLQALAEAADREALVDSRAAAPARLVGAYAAWLLVLVATLAPVAGVPPRAVPSATLMLLSAAVIWCFL